MRRYLDLAEDKPMDAIRLAAAALAAIAVATGAQAAEKSVAITQIVEHPALDACRKGVQDALADAGFVTGKTLKWQYESAQGNMATAVQIARKFTGDTPDVIVAIATPSAQAAVAATKTLPIVFSAVTDPVSAKLVSNWERPGANVTGTSDMAPVDKHLAMIKRLAPGVRRLGFLYNPGEVNSVSSLEAVRKAAPAAGIEVLEGAAPKSSEVLAAARSLIGKVDAFYVPTDNTVVSAFEAVVKVGIDAKIPVFAGDTDSVERGAVAALGFNYYEVGRQTGEMVVRILKGEKPGDIPVSGVRKMDLWLNLASAAKMGVSVPDAMVGEAVKVFR
jgi:putative ABC transport system substrate-binding protein